MMQLYTTRAIVKRAMLCRRHSKTLLNWEGTAMKRLSATLGVLIFALIPDVWAASEGSPKIPEVPAGHPRVYVRPADIPAIRVKLEMPEFKEDWAAVRRDRRPLSRAFVYLMTGDQKVGRTTIADGLSALRKCTDARTPDNAMHWGACVYDWCYPLLSAGEKQDFIKQFQRVAASHSPGYPASPQSHAIVGHGTEGWLLTDQLPAGLAIYDETQKMYDAAARLFFSKFVEARNFFYPSHMHHQGDSYIGTRLQHDLLASWLFRRIGAGDVFTRQQQYVPYQLIYHLRPDGQQMRSGDTYDASGRSNSKRRLMMLAGAYYEDPYLLTMADSDLYSGPSSYDRVFELLFRKPGLEKRPLDELPPSKYFSAPMGEMVARTGWRMGIDSPDAVVHMRIGEYFFGNHQRKDFGTFQIYYRGSLAIASGLYQGKDQPYGSDHWLNYHHQTIAHNGLLVYDPSEKMAKGSANDGGQRWPSKGADHPRDLSVLLEQDYRMGRVTAHAIGPDPADPMYSYIAGDIAEAYATGKVEKVTRSMVTLNTGDPARPCIFIIFDRVISTNASFKKTWLLHCIQEPQIHGTTSLILRNGRHYRQDARYGGKLIVESLLPKDASVTKVGGPGREFWIESTQRNYPTTKDGAAEPGAWRIEVSPKVPSRHNMFLNVLTVMDEKASIDTTSRLLSPENLIGASVANFAVFFSHGGELLQAAAVTLEGPKKAVLMCDLRPGLWSVNRGGGEAVRVRVDAQGRLIFLDGAKGLVRMSYLQP
jgi:hypothetical protein